MNRIDIKKILMALRNNSNESIINNLLGKIDLLSEDKLQQMIAQVGDENNIKQFLIEKINEQQRKYDKSQTVEKYNRESITFSQIKAVIIRIQKLLEENGLNIYISGGAIPYLLLNEDSNRLHDDVDTICKLEDIELLRELFKKEGLYKTEWDSKNYSRDGKDYGFEMEIDGVPFGIYPFDYRSRTVTQYSFDPYNKMCKTKTIPIEQLTDYICTYESRDGKRYDAMSLEYIKLSKDNAGRPKDITDSKKISEYGIRKDVMSRITMYKEIRSSGEEH